MATTTVFQATPCFSLRPNQNLPAVDLSKAGLPAALSGEAEAKSGDLSKAGPPAQKKDVNLFLFSAGIGILPEGNEVDFAVDDKAFYKARFARKICRERITGRNLCGLGACPEHRRRVLCGSISRWSLVDNIWFCLYDLCVLCG